MEDKPTATTEFERGKGSARRGLVGEFYGFLKHHKKWWLVPLLVIFLVFGALILVGGTAAAPFIYTLF
jgi:hypothetical protein